MKTTIITLTLIMAGRWYGFSQGFVNLDFESANVSGYSPGDVPVTNAMPWWNAFLYTLGNSYPTQQMANVYYDGISTGGPLVVLDDSNGFPKPLSGRYSAMLWGGEHLFQSIGISQTGLVPAGTESLLFEGYAQGEPFSITLGGQGINMIALQTFSSYTIYGADISAFAGQVETLSIIMPTETSGSYFELDNIQFSSSPVPEPSELALSALGASWFFFHRYRSSSRQ